MTYREAVMALGPAMYYRLNEASAPTQILDHSGNSRHMTVAGDPASLTSVPGLIADDTANTGLRFGPNDAGVSWTAPAQSFFGSTGSMVFWVSGLPNAAGRAIGGVMSGSTGANRWMGFICNSSRQIVLLVRDADGVLHDVGPGPTMGPDAQMIAATHDGTTARLYVNGAEVASLACTLQSSSVQYYLGRYSGTTSVALDNQVLDEWAHFTGALSAADIKQLYTLGLDTYARVVKRDQPAAYWRLGATSGTVFSDFSGNGRNLTISGTASISYNQPGLTKNYPANGSAASTANAGYAGIGVAPWMNSDNFTAEAWVQVNTTPTTASSCILARWNANSGGHFILDINATTLRLVRRNDAGTTNSTAVAHTASPILNGRPHHIVATAERIPSTTTATFKIYVDGALMITEVGSYTPATTADMRLWRRQDFTAGWTFGLIDEVAYYTQVLTQKQIKEHYIVGMSKFAEIWDGSTLKVAELVGVWDGSKILRADVAGIYNGSAIKPIRKPSPPV